MSGNYPDGMSKHDLWYLGEIPDRYGHYIGQGYDFNNPEYDPNYDDDYEGEEEENDDDDDNDDDEYYD